MDKKMHRTRHNEQIVIFLGLIGLLGLILGSAALGGCAKSNISDRKIDYINLTRAVELYDKQQKENDTALFIDTRKPERFAQGHIPGAKNMRTPDIDLRYGTDPAITRYKYLILYGENPGQASTHAMAKRMIEAGYNGFTKKRVKVYLGGWVEWEITGLPIAEPETSTGGE
jgi:rhodanese-related sulfurtransferase